MEKNHIKTALDTHLSEIQCTTHDVNLVLSKAKGEKVLKRKITISMVFAIVLILVAALALAATLLNLFVDRAVEIEATQGYYDTWDTQSRIDFIYQLASCIDDVPDSLIVALDDPSISNEEKHRLATDFMTSRYADEDVISHVTIMEKELGIFPSWSYDQKAWYTQILEKNGRLGYDQERFLLPAKADIQYDEARVVATNVLRDKFNFSDEKIASFMEDASFRFDVTFGEEPVWLFVFAPDLSQGYDTYRILISRNGELLATSEPGVDYQYVS